MNIGGEQEDECLIFAVSKIYEPNLRGLLVVLGALLLLSTRICSL